MKAIVIAAGMGKRLGELTDSRPKCMLPIDGRALLEHQIALFRALGIQEIVIITGYCAEQLQHLGSRRYYNGDYQNNNILLSLMQAASEFNDDLLVSYSDIVYSKEVVAAAVAATGDFNVVCDTDWQKSYVGRTLHPVEQAEKVVVENGQVRRIGKHLTQAEATGEFIGLAKFSRAGAQKFLKVFNEIAPVYAGKKFQHAVEFKKAYLTDFFQELVDRGEKVMPVEIRGQWLEIDTIEDYKKAQNFYSRNFGQAQELRRQGENFRSILNDLKRRPEDAARELGVSVTEIDRVLAGQDSISLDLVKCAVDLWPVSPRDFFLLKDDCPSGVKVFGADKAEASARVMQRAGKDYYEYRDTAMSSAAPFRPEWIKELCVVTDNDPENSAVQWNNGHFLHQFTYFVGPVNFYYKSSDGKKQVAVMNTGDSMYISPFVPHTFASRKNATGELGHILALTYGNKLSGEPQQELSLLGERRAQAFVRNFSTTELAFGGMLQMHRLGLSLSAQDLGKQAEITLEELIAFESGDCVPSYEVAQRLASALKVSVRDLLPPDRIESSVLVQSYAQGRNWYYPSADQAAYRVVELCNPIKMPFSKALEVNVLKDLNSDLDLQVGFHQYIYNLGSSPVVLHWEGDSAANGEVVVHTTELKFGDSCYIKPCVLHSFAGANGQLLVLRIGGRIGGDALVELSAIGAQYLPRILGETMQWFNP